MYNKRTNNKDNSLNIITIFIDSFMLLLLIIELYGMLYLFYLPSR